ncbi:unnamed protein product [Thelazia callipaeda]|uniref:CCR4-NOT transcription complex subunit 8 n=1 Tax=Thelazia callipaeda TaxID=103827 RepID=A0A0N5D3M8_THECL|nr:unnamed protein product [Thelazia callipaeda]
MSHLLSGLIEKAIEELDYFSHCGGKHGSLCGVAYLILLAAFRQHNELLYQRALSVINGNLKSRLQQICIRGCVLLTEGFHIQFVDFLRPGILLSLLDVHELFNLNDELKARIYGSLIEIHGKASNLNGLLSLWERVVAEKNLNNYRVVILKLGHFYVCNNFSLPKDLQYYLRQYRE